MTGLKTIFYNGQVVTVDSQDRVCEAIVFSGNTIAFVGSSAEALGYREAQDRVLDLQGRAVLPGFIDSHIHMSVSGLTPSQADSLTRENGVQCVEDILTRVRQAVQHSEPGEWSPFSAYNQDMLDEGRHVTRQELDAAAPHNPVILNHVGGHVGVCNTQALQEGGVFDAGSYPEEHVLRNESGGITGVLKESAYFQMLRHVPLEPSDTAILDALERYAQKTARYGITSTHDAGGFGRTTFRTLQLAYRQGRLTSRCYPMLWTMYGKEAQLENVRTHIQAGFFTGLGDDGFKIGPLKIITDGASCGTCATREPFSNTGEQLDMTFTQEEIDAFVLEAHKNHFQVTAHAIGDRAVEAVVHALEAAQERYPRKDCRHRIEHCMICPPDLTARIKAVGAIPVPNPNFIAEWGSIYTKYYGKRCEYIFPVRDYLDAGIICPFGSDASSPPDFRPLWGIAAAMERRDLSTGEAVGMRQAVSLMEAVRCYTYYGAYASFDEERKGSLEQGKLADLVVLSDAILGKTPEQLRSMYVAETVMDGKTTFSVDSMPSGFDPLAFEL